MSDDEHTQEAEEAWLQVVRDAQKELAYALDSLGEKQFDGIERFIGFSGRQINYAVDAYVSLREAGRIGSSKLLVRPAIEIMFRAKAVSEQPVLIYRMLFREKIDRARWIGPTAAKHGVDFDPEGGWDKFREYCVSRFPGEELINHGLKLRDVAVKIGLEGYYDSHYRTYCQFTHASLEAITGDLDKLTDPEDNRTVALCTVITNRALLTIGARTERLELIEQRMATLGIDLGGGATPAE